MSIPDQIRFYNKCYLAVIVSTLVLMNVANRDLVTVIGVLAIYVVGLLQWTAYRAKAVMERNDTRLFATNNINNIIYFSILFTTVNLSSVFINVANGSILVYCGITGTVVGIVLTVCAVRQKARSG